MDNVNHPQHYTKEGHKECILEMIDVFGIEAVRTFCLLNAFKYQYRAGLKDGNSFEQDTAKFTWYMNKYYELAKE